MKWSVRNTRVETGLRGLRLVVVDEQARELLAGSGTVLLLLLQWLHGCRTRQLIVTCRVGELAYRPQLAQPMTPPVVGPLQPGGSSRSGLALSTRSVCLTVCMAVWTVWTV